MSCNLAPNLKWNINMSRVMATSPTATYQADKTAGDFPRRRHYGYASSSALVSTTPPRLFRVSLVREVLREIRNLFWRIGEIRRRELDRQGIWVNPLPDKSYPLALRERALGDCSTDTHNLCTSRHHVSLIEVQKFVQGWTLGCAWGLRNSGNKPGA